MKIVVIGGVAAGTSAASQAKRRKPEAEVILLERGPDVSYGACGMPYNIGDEKREMDDLVAVSAQQFRAKRHIDLRTRHEVVSIDTNKQALSVRDLDAATDYELAYDELVIATGASAFVPPLSGIDLEGVFSLRELTDGSAIKRFIAEKKPTRAVIIGAGYIGMEMAEALRSRDVTVCVVEKADQVVPGFEPEIAALVTEELRHQGVRVETGVSVSAIEKRGSGLVVVCDRGEFGADLVLVSVGVRPNVALAKAAGVTLGKTGAIAVDDEQRTNVSHVFAAGDCAEARHLVTGKPTWIPLGTTANKQGKVAGANAAGANETFGGIVGTAAFKVFRLEVGRTGLARADVAREKLDAVFSKSEHKTRAGSYPGGQDITTVLVAERGSRRVLGAQIVSQEGVAGRIGIFATALHARMTVDDVESLDLAYAPPLAPVYDPVLIAASVARKELGGAGD